VSAFQRDVYIIVIIIIIKNIKYILQEYRSRIPEKKKKKKENISQISGYDGED
jgi:hypothetical protein